MGLDITAYAQMKLLKASEKYDECSNEFEPQDAVFLWDDNWPVMQPLVHGWYGPAGEKSGRLEFSFRAGSYSGYNAWRDELSRCMLGIPQEVSWERRDLLHPSSPWSLIVNYSDCEGAISAENCRILADAFVTRRPQAEEYAKKMTRDGDAEWFLRVYDNFARAFELGSDGGFVKFH